MNETLRKSLGPLIALLGSNHDGEVLAAARAIGRKLDAADADFIDLARHVEAQLQFGFVDTADADDQAMTLFCMQHAVELRKGERGFIENIFARCHAGRDLTTKQRNWLVAIYRRLHDEAA